MTVSEEQMRRLRRVKMAHEKDLMKRANVIGVGIGFREQAGKRTGEPAIVVSVTRKVPHPTLSPEDRIPQQLEGIPVDVQVVGEPKALDTRGG